MTTTVWVAENIRRLSVTTRTLWHFLRPVAAGTLTDAIRDTRVPLSDRTFRRIVTRFDRAQVEFPTVR